MMRAGARDVTDRDHQHWKGTDIGGVSVTDTLPGAFMRSSLSGAGRNE